VTETDADTLVLAVTEGVTETELVKLRVGDGVGVRNTTALVGGANTLTTTPFPN
jgi:hypothetical protein